MQPERAEVFVRFIEHTFAAGSPISQQQLMRIAESDLSSAQSGGCWSVEHSDKNGDEVRVKGDLVRVVRAILADHYRRSHYSSRRNIASWLHTELSKIPRWAKLTPRQARRALEIANTNRHE